jgi:hypothetical protein
LPKPTKTRCLEASYEKIVFQRDLSHPDFAVLTVPWELARRADGYAMTGRPMLTAVWTCG